MKAKDIEIGDVICLDCSSYGDSPDPRLCKVLKIDHREMHPLFGHIADFYSFDVDIGNGEVMNTHWFKGEDNL